MKIKTQDLSGIQLDYAVALAEGGTNFISDNITHSFTLKGETKVLAKGWAASMSFTPSTNWAQMGPIIERERITVLCPTTGDFFEARDTKAFRVIPEYWRGSTYLEAAARCYVASKLGDEVDIPEELK